MSNFDESKVNRQRDGKFGFKSAGVPTASLSDLSGESPENLEKKAKSGEITDFAPLVACNNPQVRKVAAQYGSDTDRDMLIHDEHPSVRSTVASFGTDAQRKMFVNDPSIFVRYTAVFDGGVEVKRAFKNDKEPSVREACAGEGADEELRSELAKDEHYLVRHSVAKFTNNEETMNMLVTDKDQRVRAIIAMRGGENLKKQLMNDTDPRVLSNVLAATKDRSVVEHLSRCDIPIVSNGAKIRLGAMN
ncbi:hypothetical protein [Actinomyces vulturis]|uniref:hypothetical protein n=1 Tax=Actinomyces vulturis TaxID=1857645 RepID=UPI000830451E|nr:hypothetical protein [Actinomyces vulturis]